jgi:hypothetical protein
MAVRVREVKYDSRARSMSFYTQLVFMHLETLRPRKASANGGDVTCDR